MNQLIIGFIVLRSCLNFLDFPSISRKAHPSPAIARTTGTYSKVIEQYKKPALLILDEWLLYQLKESEARDLLEIAEARYKKGSMILCSQFDVPGWRDKIGSPIIADAICDRIVHDSYRIVIECEESMRKIFGVDQSEA